ncbi:hypothetical protein D7X74_34275 [Corallococcus sp. CA047B]|uniref:hypothetical protein n=1 Tax=Corallococcus sp. CA047B TaxID=2316729 RepID=UPI000EA09264|nr:hypothetical protein [Corallococcus sp. CA047B]RKH05781.1 hypothetical protein D7X74_34275 [Corallococcus sp. CA047B]
MLWCKDVRHVSVKEQHRTLSSKLLGHYGYYGITGNSQALARFRHEVAFIWRKWLNRRSQRQSMPWWKFSAMLKRHPLPPVRAVHSVLRVAKP